MKKIFSLLLAVLMLVSALPVAYAAETADYTVGTQVVYTAANAESYSITVPAQLAPGASGTVTLSGSWASNQTVKVTADKTVTLTNSINAADQKTLDVTFAGMEYAGDNTQARTYTEPVSVAAMPSDALFGSWDGKFNYNVEMTESEPEDEMVTVTVNYIDATCCEVVQSHTNATLNGEPEVVNLPVGTVLECWVCDDYDGDGNSGEVILNGENVYSSQDGSYYYTLTKNISITINTVNERGIITITEAGAEPDTNLITFTINGTEYQAEEGMTWGTWADSDYNTVGATIEGDSIYVNGNAIQKDGYEESRRYTIVSGGAYTIDTGAEPEVETATLTIGDYATSHFSVSVDGVSQNDTTLTVPVGTVVEISAIDLRCDKGCSDGSASVYLNDNLVESGSESLTYSYTVTGDAAISFSANPDLCRDCNNYAIAANVYITEG